MQMGQAGINPMHLAIFAISAMRATIRQPTKPLRTQAWSLHLSDVKASCQQCHAADLDARAQVYASTLGVTIGSDSSAPTSGGDVDAVPVVVVSAPNVAVQSELQ